MDIIRTDRKKRRTPYYLGAGVVGLGMITVLLGQLKPAAPGVESAAVYTDTVRRGTFTRQVRGPGTLVPEHIVIISARTNGRVEELFAQPGTAVQPGTLLLRLSNPDVQLQLLESERLLTQARSGLIQLQATLQSQTLELESALASAQSAFNQAQRQVREAEALAARGLIAGNEASRRRDELAETEQRLSGAKQQLALARSSLEPQLEGQRLQVQRLEGIVRYRQGEVESLNVRAPAAGVLQRLGTQATLEVGQWVFSGTELARVVQPGRLKAQIRIPETQIRDVVVGQAAYIDTRTDTIRGRVVRVDPAAQMGTVGVDVTLEGELPASARPDLSVDGTIELDRVQDALFVGRPSYGAAGQTVSLFRLTPDGHYADRIPVKLGRTSVNHVEILGGLKVGDVIILSDMSTWDQHERVRLH